jgi:hypothetical protein
LNTLLDEEDRKTNLLAKELEIEQESISTLTHTIEMYELDKVKTLNNLDEAIKLSQDLDPQRRSLKLLKQKLSKDLEHLEKNHSLLKGELTTHRKTYDQLHASHMKTLAIPSALIVVDLNACATNILCDEAPLLEENKRLKVQLENGLISCI